MTVPHQFAADVFRIICERLDEKADDLRLMAEAASCFDEWLSWEAFLACKRQEASYPFWEVTARPPYGGTNGEGVTDESGNPYLKRGDLRVGGSGEKGDHRWMFAEFVLVHDGNYRGDKWQRTVHKNAARLKRLGWVNSISMLVVVSVSAKGDPRTAWGDTLTGSAEWNRPALTDAHMLPLFGGEALVAKAFDIKQNQEHVQSFEPRTGC